MSRKRDPGSISTRLRRIAEIARTNRDQALISLHQFIDRYWMEEAYARTRKDGAVGVDGETAEQFAKDREVRLALLLEGLKSGLYRAPPVRRAWVPKGDGASRRPIGIPTFEDKVLQRSVAMVLEAVYEEEFFDFSYGCRPGRSSHDALRAVRDAAMELRGGWVLEVDIRSFFEDLDHSHLRSFLDRRVRDGVLRRAIGKWLQAGVLEEDRVHGRQSGTPQGGVISPLLANIYLHEVLDRWFADEVQPRLRGKAFLVRYVDDVVLLFSHEEDARRVLEVLAKRLSRYGLRLHEEKTRLVRFHRPSLRGHGGSKPGSFDFLGFNHHWGRSRRGNWVVRQTTAKDRIRRVLRRCSLWCRKHRHQPVWWQHERLSRALVGHAAYYGITGNSRALGQVSHQVERIWHKWLARRSQRGMTWRRFQSVLHRYPLPRPRIAHRYANA